MTPAPTRTHCKGRKAPRASRAASTTASEARCPAAMYAVAVYSSAGRCRCNAKATANSQPIAGLRP